jgi:hypothetical protein
VTALSLTAFQSDYNGGGYYRGSRKMCIFVTCIQLPKAELGYSQNERGLQAHVWSVDACISTPRVNDAPVRRGRVAVPGYGR